MLKPEVQAEILSRFFGKGEKVRAIARALGINRKSVDRVIARRSVQIGYQRSGRGSVLDPFVKTIEELLGKDKRLPVVVLLKHLRDAGYDGGYTILREWVKAHRPLERADKEAFFKIEFVPGQAAQVDWGEFGDVFGDGCKIHCFVMVLCHCRLLYVEFTRAEKFEDFVRCHENAIRYFEGRVPEFCWYDNLATAVAERMGQLIRFNARFFAYLGHHGIKGHACNKARGNEKGRVENGVKFVRHNFWPGREFRDFQDLCNQASQWRDETANLREHRITRKIPRLHFEAEEREALRSGNPQPYETDEVFSEQVRPGFHITYDTNQYSVPWTLVGSVVTVRVNAEWFEVYYHERFVTRHERCYRKHQRPFTKPEHQEGLLEIKPQGKNASLTWQIETLKSYGKSVTRYLECLKQSHRSLRNETSRLLALATVYGVDQLENAVAQLLSRGSIGTEHLELALKAQVPEKTKPIPLTISNPVLMRIPPKIDLSGYDALLFRPEQQEQPGPAQKQGDPNHDSSDTQPAK